MEKILDYKGCPVRITDEGTGVPVVLLHGYLESLNIWDAFADRLKEHCRVICIDIPGHGKSGVIDEVHSMELMAQTVQFVLDAQLIEKCILTGHSMGGYAALAFAENYPERLLGLCLFHATPFADTEEKIQNRDREIEMIKAGKKDLICKTNIPKGFADDNLAILKNEVDRAIRIAMQSSNNGIIALLRGMKSRPDRSHVIKTAGYPLLWILGKKDNYIQFENIRPRIELNDLGALLVLENSGHMGFIEEPDISVERFVSFTGKCSG
ncbi:MAG: alpha/beta fold hydrolase [Bacteroidales bacterium]|nr:alpha/beta fold hydrolase [Bacteroidales bacterium]